MKNPIVHLKEYWVIYAFATQLVFNYAGFINFKETISNEVFRNENRIEKLEALSQTNVATQSEINSRLASIETSILYIREALRQ